MCPKVLQYNGSMRRIHCADTLLDIVTVSTSILCTLKPRLLTFDKRMLLIKNSWGYWILGEKPRITEVRVLQRRVLQRSDCTSKCRESSNVFVRRCVPIFKIFSGGPHRWTKMCMSLAVSLILMGDVHLLHSNFICWDRRRLSKLNNELDLYFKT